MAKKSKKKRKKAAKRRPAPKKARKPRRKPAKARKARKKPRKSPKPRKRPKGRRKASRKPKKSKARKPAGLKVAVSRARVQETYDMLRAGGHSAAESKRQIIKDTGEHFAALYPGRTVQVPTSIPFDHVRIK